jgi:hypothetical protein
MEQSELLKYLINCLERLNIPYFITGAIASIAYGEPRLTNDIDVVAEMNEAHVPKFIACFPAEEFYLDEDSIRTAIRQKQQFNIIHPASGLKIDIMISKGDDFDQSRFARKKRLRPIEEAEANFSSPEDLIIIKLAYYKEGSSEKHIRDVLGILKISAKIIDFDYLSYWVKRLNLKSVWEAVLEKQSK